eukprot:15300589-Alexandrium_andersonii.AAC.1
MAQADLRRVLPRPVVAHVVRQDPPLVDLGLSGPGTCQPAWPPHAPARPRSTSRARVRDGSVCVCVCACVLLAMVERDGVCKDATEAAQLWSPGVGAGSSSGA